MNATVVKRILDEIVEKSRGMDESFGNGEVHVSFIEKGESPTTVLYHGKEEPLWKVCPEDNLLIVSLDEEDNNKKYIDCNYIQRIERYFL